MAKYYLDSSIWRDYYENRSDKFKPLGEWALMLIHKIIKEKSYILYSDFILKELSIKYSQEEIKNIFDIVNKKQLLLRVKILKIQVKQAATISKKRKVPFGDVLHTILASNNNAIMVTRDKHFLELIDLTNIKKPEELI